MIWCICISDGVEESWYHSLHLTKAGALKAVPEVIAERESPWKGEWDEAEWKYHKLDKTTWQTKNEAYTISVVSRAVND